MPNFRYIWIPFTAAIFAAACNADSSDSSSMPSSLSETQAFAEDPAPQNSGSDASVFSALPAPYNGADYNHGRRVYTLCQSCHTLEKGAPNVLGPNLHGMFGRSAGSAENYIYSQKITQSGIVWTPEQLSQWLENPQEFLPGNRMSFAGIKNSDDRNAVIAYIMLETGYTE